MFFERRLAPWAAVASLMLSVHPVLASSQARTDVVLLANGDRITGEVIGLNRGRLELETDSACAIDIEWDDVVGVTTTNVVEVITADGRRFLGRLASATSGELDVIGIRNPVSLPTGDVTAIRRVEGTFWTRIDFSVDAGFSYTRSSGIAQLNVNVDAVHRRPASQYRLTASMTGTSQAGVSERDDRGSLEASYVRQPHRRWFLAGAARFETNQSLGLRLRSQIATAAGPRLINSNRGQLLVGAGMALSGERGLEVDTRGNLDALVILRASFYTYDRPRTSLDVSIDDYTGVSDAGRQRLQIDVSAKREFWKDLYLALTLYNTYDSRPPSPAVNTNDIGVVASMGWSK